MTAGTSRNVERPSRLALLFDAIFSRHGASSRDSRLALAALVVLAVLALRVIVEAVPIAGSVASELDVGGWNRDFVQEYLVARAVQDGRDPYVPLVDLAGDYLPAAVARSLPNPTPHPPTLIPFIRPLGTLPFEMAGLVWLGLQLVAVVGLALVLAAWCRGGKLAGRRSLRDLLLAVALVLVWPPTAVDILQGQLGLVLTALFVAGWYAAARGHERLAGIALGLAMSVKLVPGLLLLHFLIRRQFRVVGWSALTFGTVALTALSYLGVGPFLTYMSQAVPQTSEIWLASYWNNSVFGALGRALGMSTRLLPLVEAPALAVPLALLGAGSLCLAALYLDARAASRSKGSELRAESGVEFAIWVVVMLLVSPVVWYHYFVSLLFPLAVLGRLIARRGWRGPDLSWLLAGTVVVAALPGVGVGLRRIMPGFEPLGETLSALAYAGSVVPMLGLLLLLGLLAREQYWLAPVPSRVASKRRVPTKLLSLERGIAE